jgi:hypothetical protein
MFTDGDIFITNVTTTYEDIPKYCNLVGAEFDQDYLANSTRLYDFGYPVLACCVLFLPKL